MRIEPGSPYNAGSKSKSSMKLLSQLKTKMPKINLRREYDQKEQYDLIDQVEKELKV
jgi:hypothetical protein